MYGEFQQHLQAELDGIREAGFYKNERVITTPQGSHVEVATGEDVINLCANNYLGLAQDARVKAAAREGLERWGYGMASVRFICGTQSIHKQLEDQLSAWLGMEDTILYPSCFDANGGLYETLLGAEDAVISDELNHASIIDGVRLCKAQRYRYKNADMADLEAQLQAADAAGARFKLIATDGVFSMDGYIAPLAADLRPRRALWRARPCRRQPRHRRGRRRRPRHARTLRRDGPDRHRHRHARQGARRRQRRLHQREAGDRRAAPPALAPLSLLQHRRPGDGRRRRKAVELAAAGDDLRARLRDNMRFFREGLTEAGFELLPGEHPIIPVMLHDARRAAALAEALLAKGVYVIAFSYPVVPKGKARIRTQISATHTRDELERAVSAFAEAGRDFA